MGRSSAQSSQLLQVLYSFTKGQLAIFFFIKRNLQENKLKCKNGSRREARRASAALSASEYTSIHS
jgi:hypothetical protein